MAKECVPSTKSKSLIRMQLIKGADKLRSTTLDLYQHHTSQDEMYSAMVEVFNEESKLDRLNSPFHCLSIEADEATDVSNASIVIVFIRYVEGHRKVDSRYLWVEKFQATTSEDIFFLLLVWLIFELIMNNEIMVI